MSSWHIILTSFKFLSLIIYKYESHLFIFHLAVFLAWNISNPLTSLQSNPVDYKELQGSKHLICFSASLLLKRPSVSLSELPNLCPSRTTESGSAFLTRLPEHSHLQLKFERYCDNVAMPYGSCIEILKNYIIFYNKLCYGLSCVPSKFTCWNSDP